jgi:shikimate kinase
MKSKKNLVLLGMMGSGKSTIGSIVSKKLNINFFDTDKFIEKETNMTIKEIFNKKGESFFRDLEEKTVLKLLQSSNNVISLGGGSFINEKVRTEVLTNNFSLWLNWKTSKLINRIKNSKKRPIAFNLKNNELIHLIEKRSKIYEKASFKINCDKMTKTEIVNKILYLYEHN